MSELYSLRESLGATRLRKLVAGGGELDGGYFLFAMRLSTAEFPDSVSERKRKKETNEKKKLERERGEKVGLFACRMPGI